MHLATFMDSIERIVKDPKSDLETTKKFLLAIRKACGISSKRDVKLLHWVNPIITDINNTIRILNEEI